MLELGGRVPVGADMALRPFIAAGTGLFSNDFSKETARLARLSRIGMVHHVRADDR